MNIPRSGLIDEIAVQKALALLLCDNATLAKVPVMPETKLLMESELLVDALWTLPRAAFTVTTDGWVVNQGVSGLVGGGVLVEMPEMDTHSQGVSGPVATWRVGVVGFCELNTALVPGVGVGLTASQMCQAALDQLHNQNVYGLGTFVSDQAIRYARDWVDLKPGVSAYRVTLTATVGRVQSTRSVPATVAFAGGNCSLECPDPGATIYFTTDGTVPAASNPSTETFSAPFSVRSGTTVMFMTEKAGLINSQVHGATAP